MNSCLSVGIHRRVEPLRERIVRSFVRESELSSVSLTSIGSGRVDVIQVDEEIFPDTRRLIFGIVDEEDELVFDLIDQSDRIENEMFIDER